MTDVLNLALPYFGLIVVGFICGKVRRIPDTGLAWMNFFIIYVALPALFFRIVARTPFEELNNVAFVAATTLATALAFALSFGIGLAIRRGQIAESTVAALAGSYGNIGYTGPGLTLGTLGPAAAAPVALIFCFDTILLFSLVPFLMAMAGTRSQSVGATALAVVKRILLNPFIMATLAGVLAAALRVEIPVALDRLMEFLQNAAAPCALFTLGLTVALRPIDKMPWEVPCLVPVKLLVHPILAMLTLSLLGSFSESWVYTAILMAALPPALNVFITARQYDVWVAQASGSVLLGTAVSIVTLTGFMWLAKTHRLPVDLFP